MTKYFCILLCQKPTLKIFLILFFTSTAQPAHAAEKITKANNLREFQKSFACIHAECQTLRLLMNPSQPQLVTESQTIDLLALSENYFTFNQANPIECFYPGCREVVGISGFLSFQGKKAKLGLLVTEYVIPEDHDQPLFHTYSNIRRFSWSGGSIPH